MYLVLHWIAVSDRAASDFLISEQSCRVYSVAPVFPVRQNPSLLMPSPSGTRFPESFDYSTAMTSLRVNYRARGFLLRRASDWQQHNLSCLITDIGLAVNLSAARAESPPLYGTHHV